MNILVVNDDGINHNGIHILSSWAKKFGNVLVVAPKIEQSAKSHSINIHTPFEVQKVAEERYSIDSSPADCVRFALYGLNRKIDLVLSGINKGYNVGEDIAYSGTCSAIFEACYDNIPAIAFSTIPDSFDHVIPMLDESYNFILENKLFDYNLIYNVNLPPTRKGILITRQGGPFYKDRFKQVSESMYIADGYSVYNGSSNLEYDLDAVMNNYISISPLSVERTNLESYNKLKALNI